MKITKLHEKILPVILILVCIFFNLLISVHYFHTELNPDENLYNNMALALLDGKNAFDWGSSKQIDIGQEVTPFYSAIVAGTYFIYLSPWSPVAVNIILNCATIILLFFTIRNITNNILISFLFSLGFIFYFPLWAYNFFIMMEVTTVFFISLVLFLLTKYFVRKQSKYMIQVTMVFSILILINNRYIVLFGVYVIFIAIYLANKNKLDLKKFLFSLLLAIAVLSPWFIRQYKTYNQFVFFTPLWNNVVAEKIGVFQKVDFTSIEKLEQNKNPNSLKSFEEYNFEIKNGNNRIKTFELEDYKKLINNKEDDNSIYFIRLKKFFTLFYNNYQFSYPRSYNLIVPSSLQLKLIQLFFLLPLILFSMIGVLIGCVKKNYLIVLMGLMFITYVILHVLIHFIDRYRLTIIPVLLVLAAYGINELIKETYSRKKLTIPNHK